MSKHERTEMNKKKEFKTSESFLAEEEKSEKEIWAVKGESEDMFAVLTTYKRGGNCVINLLALNIVWQ